MGGGSFGALAFGHYSSGGSQPSGIAALVARLTSVVSLQALRTVLGIP